MSNIFIIHGAFGNPGENWFPWLKKELENIGHKVFVPKFPTPENQTLENWKNVFVKYEKFLDKDSIVIGHSLGSTFLLTILENLKEPIKASFFVAGFINLLGNPVFDEINKTFVNKNFDWQKIKQNCEKFYLFYSDNDPFIPIEESENLADKLDIKSLLVPNAGHFNKKVGFIKFELLLEDIKKELN